MSDLFMDTQRRCQRWHYQPNTPPASTTASTSATAATTTSDSPSSIQYTNDQLFSHHSKNSSAAGERTDHNANYNFYNSKDHKTYEYDDDNADDAFDNILSLKLKKPKHWKWELTTSKSCSNIALPRILLYDHKGELLVDAQGDNEAVYKQEDQQTTQREKSKKRAHEPKQQQGLYQQRAATVNLTHSIRQALETDFNGLHIQEATPSPKLNSPMSLSSRGSRKAIDLSTNDLPDYGISRRSSSLKGVRFNVENGEDAYVNESHIPEFLPTPPSTTTPTSSSSGPREKRKYRRSHSSGRSSAHSESILERFSYQKGRFSSPEYADEMTVQRSPRYFLRTCKAGTLVVKEDSFYLHPRRRRRPIKNRSTESLQSVKKASFLDLVHDEKLPSLGSPTPSDTSCTSNLKQRTPHHYLSKRNIVLKKQLSTSEEDTAGSALGEPLMDNANGKHSRKCSRAQNQREDIKYATDIHRNGKVR